VGVGAEKYCCGADEFASFAAQFNVLWLDPTNPDAFPDGLVEAMGAAAAADAEWGGSGSQGSNEERLRAQMQADALRPLGDDDDLPKKADASVARASLPPRTIEDAAQFLRLDPVERLDRVLRYLRAEYHYCFWCGTQYESSDEMQAECPGPDEDMHD